MKQSAATGLTFTFAGLIRAHGQSGGGNNGTPETTWATTWATDVSTTSNQEVTCVTTSCPGCHHTTTSELNGTPNTTTSEYTTTCELNVIETTEAETIQTTEATGGWLQNKEEHILYVRINHNLLAQSILNAINATEDPITKNLAIYKDSLPMRSKIDVPYILSKLGLNAGGDTSASLTQTVTWESYHSPLTSPPSKYRKLCWSYGGNDLTGLNSSRQLNPGRMFGYFIQTIGALQNDKWELGSVSIDRQTILTTGVQDVSISSLPPGQTWYYPSVPPNDQATITRGGVENAAQKVEASGDWEGTNDAGVSSFTLDHTGNMIQSLAVCRIQGWNSIGMQIFINLNLQEVVGSGWFLLSPANSGSFNPLKKVTRAPSNLLNTSQGAFTAPRWTVKVIP